MVAFPSHFVGHDRTFYWRTVKACMPAFRKYACGWRVPLCRCSRLVDWNGAGGGAPAANYGAAFVQHSPTGLRLPRINVAPRRPHFILGSESMLSGRAVAAGLSCAAARLLAFGCCAAPVNAAGHLSGLPKTCSYFDNKPVSWCNVQQRCGAFCHSVAAWFCCLSGLLSGLPVACLPLRDIAVRARC